MNYCLKIICCRVQVVYNRCTDKQSSSAIKCLSISHSIKNNLQMNLVSLALLFPSLVLALPTIGEVPTTGREVPRSLSSRSARPDSRPNLRPNSRPNSRPNLRPNSKPNSRPNLRSARPNYDSISLLVTGAPYPSLWLKPSLITNHQPPLMKGKKLYL